VAAGRDNNIWSGGIPLLYISFIFPNNILIAVSDGYFKSRVFYCREKAKGTSFFQVCRRHRLITITLARENQFLKLVTLDCCTYLRCFFGKANSSFCVNITDF